MPSLISGCGARSSIVTNAASKATASANPPIVSGALQPTSGASTTVRTSSSIAAVMVNAPAKS